MSHLEGNLDSENHVKSMKIRLNHKRNVFGIFTGGNSYDYIIIAGCDSGRKKEYPRTFENINPKVIIVNQFTRFLSVFMFVPPTKNH